MQDFPKKIKYSYKSNVPGYVAVWVRHKLHTHTLTE